MTSRKIVAIFLCLLALSCSSVNHGEHKSPTNASVLVFCKTAGYYHQSIPDGLAALQQLGTEHQIQVDTTRDASRFTADGLKPYDAVVFLNTTGDVLDTVQQAAFQQFIRSGKGFVGIHSATDTEYSWPWYNRLAGAYFSSHPEIQDARIQVVNKQHPSTSFLPDVWQRRDEWYNFKSLQQGITVLANLDEQSYKGGTNGAAHPIAWYHEFDGGRAWYTAGGHTSESYKEPLFLKHILGGLQYAIGK
jgi:type 1 glutamine amidotransferase